MVPRACTSDFGLSADLQLKSSASIASMIPGLILVARDSSSRLRRSSYRRLRTAWPIETRAASSSCSRVCATRNSRRAATSRSSACRRAIDAATERACASSTACFAARSVCAASCTWLRIWATSTSRSWMAAFRSSAVAGGLRQTSFLFMSSLVDSSATVVSRARAIASASENFKDLCPDSSFATVCWYSGTPRALARCARSPCDRPSSSRRLLTRRRKHFSAVPGSGTGASVPNAINTFHAEHATR